MIGTTVLRALGLSVLLLQATPSRSFQHRSSAILPTASVAVTAPTTTTATAFGIAARRPSSSFRLSASSSSDDSNGKPQPYVPIREDLNAGSGKKALIPRIGDVVRYYDLDGGDATGEVLVGKISYVFGSKAYSNGFSVELSELEDVGDGYYAEYSSALISRGRRKTERRLSEVSPIAASFVGSEQAWKVPIDGVTKLPKVRQETYDIDAYEGPSAYGTIDTNVVERDAENYAILKAKLFRNVLLTGLVGTILANATSGAELAIIYFAGSVASLLYLFLLSVKTDTVAVNSEDNTKNLAGTPFANLRFGAPVLVLVGVSVYNAQKMSSGLGGDDDEFTMRLFDTVTREQFAAAVLGFLTYRLPLFVGQLRDAFKELEAETATGGEDAEGGVRLPGSAGVAAKLLSKKKGGDGVASSGSTAASESTVTVLLVSGPQATGRPELVERLLADGNGDFEKNLVAPERVSRRDDGATYERLERRNEFLEVDAPNEVGLTKDGILRAARGATVTAEGEKTVVPNKNVVVVDASVELARTLTTANFGSGNDVRLVCVWVGLNSVRDFEERLEASIADGSLTVPEDEPKDSFLRAKVKDIVNEIDFGLGSGIFEFTILNDASDPDRSLRELKEATSYAFK